MIKITAAMVGVVGPGALVLGSAQVVAPMSWTQRVAGFATDPTLLAMLNRVLLIPPRMTQLAQQKLPANGWSVRSTTQP